MKWEYNILNFSVVERWSSKRQQEEIQKFTDLLDEMGDEGWEMIGYESIPMMGGFTGQQKGYAYLTFFKRQKK